MTKLLTFLASPLGGLLYAVFLIALSFLVAFGFAEALIGRGVLV